MFLRKQKEFFISYFFCYQKSTCLSFSETIEKWLLLSCTFSMAEAEPINADSKSQSKNTAKDNYGWLRGGGGKRLGQTQQVSRLILTSHHNGFGILIRVKPSNAHSWRKQHHETMLMLSPHTCTYRHTYQHLQRKHSCEQDFITVPSHLQPNFLNIKKKKPARKMQICQSNL